MSKIDELINKLCPNGVKYYELGELGKFYGGLTGKSKEDFKDGNAKFITYMNVYKNLALDLELEDKVKIGENENQRTLEYGDIIFTGSSETPDECGISSVVTKRTNEKLYLNSFCFFYRLDDPTMINPDLAKHLFRSGNLRYQISKTASGVTRFNVSKKLMEKVRIPVPPMEVQCEIVRILDDFTLLPAELSAELKARQKQYNYYANTLFENLNRDNIQKISEVADVFDSLHQTPKYVEEGFSMIRVADVKGGYVDASNALKVDETTYKKFTEKYKPQFNDIIFSRVGTYGTTCLVGNEDVCLGQNTSILHSKINAKYLYYFLNSEYVRNYIESNLNGAGYKNITLKNIKEIPIIVPSELEQEKIVSILDRFDKLCNDITQGLPAEIAARQKQYEYYRDKLLTFKELKK